MIVVSDTSPLTALFTVNKAEILIKLFGRVIIPTAVESELHQSHSTFPISLEVRKVKDILAVERFAQTVDLGEAEAIELAKELKADRLLIDERRGRHLAAREGIPVIGLLGVVLLAKRQHMIPSARQLLDQLEDDAGIFLSSELKAEALATVGE